MKVHSDINNLPSFRNAVVTIGTFDGVHAGHRKIIGQLISEARKNEGESIIITFHPHPKQVVGSHAQPIHLLTTIAERILLLERLGLDHLVVVPFDLHFSNLSAQEYVEEFLLKKFSPHTLIIGFDHRFGKGRTGDFHLLEEYALNRQFHLIEISQHIIHELKVSSTRIREELNRGNVDEANELLGYTYFFSGTVVTGDQIGRTIGYPTANVKMDNAEKLLPANGIYAVFARLNDHDAPIYKGMMSIGIRPTVGGTKEVTEVYLFDFNRDIYGRQLEVFVVKRLRDEVKFPDLPSLTRQIDQDAQDSLGVLASSEILKLI